MKSRYRAFTLIELLVVICVIGVLMGFLIPALAAAKQAAKRGQVRATISLLVQALKAYEEDWGSYPPATNDSANDANATALVTFLDGNKFNGVAGTGAWSALPPTTPPLTTLYMDFKLKDIDLATGYLISPLEENPGNVQGRYRYSLDPGPPRQVIHVVSYGPDGLPTDADNITSDN